jgi:hypothetical protein
VVHKGVEKKFFFLYKNQHIDVYGSFSSITLLRDVDNVGGLHVGRHIGKLQDFPFNFAVIVKLLSEEQCFFFFLQVL